MRPALLPSAHQHIASSLVFSFAQLVQKRNASRVNYARWGQCGRRHSPSRSRRSRASADSRRISPRRAAPPAPETRTRPSTEEEEEVMINMRHCTSRLRDNTEHRTGHFMPCTVSVRVHVSDKAKVWLWTQTKLQVRLNTRCHLSYRNPTRCWRVGEMQWSQVRSEQTKYPP